jgi:hypothetical protein
METLENMMKFLGLFEPIADEADAGTVGGAIDEQSKPANSNSLAALESVNPFSPHSMKGW